MKKKFLTVLVTVVTVLTVAGCGGKKEEAPAATTETKEQTDVAVEDSTGDEASGEGEAEASGEDEASSETEVSGEEEVSADVEASGEDEGQMSDASGEGENEDPFANLSQYLQVGYAGSTDDGARVLWAVDNDLTYGLMVMQNGDETIVFYGNIDKNDDGTITINHEYGGSITLTVEKDNDGAYILTLEDGSMIVVYEVPVDDVINEFKNISEGNRSFDASSEQSLAD